MPSDTAHTTRNSPLWDYLAEASQTGQVPAAATLAGLPCSDPDPAAWRQSVETLAEEIARQRRAGAHHAARQMVREVPAEIAAGAGTPDAEPDPTDALSPDDIADRVQRR